MRSCLPLPLVLLLLAAACGPNPQPPPAAGGVDTAGPGLELTLRSLDGTTLELSELRGKVVLVDVWATWCGPCLMALPGLIRISKLRPDELVVVGLSTDQNKAALAGFLRDNPLPYFVAHADGPAMRTFRAAALPTVFVLDKRGRLVETLVGMHPDSHLVGVAERYL